MYTIVKNVIMSARFELNDMMRKIDTLWAQGDLDEVQRTELMELARAHADPFKTAGLAAQVENLEKRVKALEEGGSTAPAPSEDWPLYEEGHWYYAGDHITWEDKHYTCIAPKDTVCVWNPTVMPTYWQMQA